MAKLVSVNVGLPKDVEWQGRTVRTAIWKRAATGRVMARKLNLDGDGQGDLEGHGGEHRAIMVYQLESYEHWKQFFGRADFEYGQFGENFTVEGMADNEVCIGDRYRIGGALFEVSQPRVTCYRVGIRMNEPRMPALLVSHKRPGFYFRVLEEGQVGAGDEIVKVAEGPERVTVEEVDGLLYLPDHAQEGLRRALRVPALSAGWKQSLEALLSTDHADGESGNRGLAPSSSPPPAWPGFRSLRVAEIRSETEDVRSFVLESVTDAALPAPLPGQFVVVKLSLEDQSAPVIRNYSISGICDSGKYRISVKRGSGRGSQYLHDRVAVGDTIAVSAPRGAFLLTPGSNPVVLLGAGIGATPLIAMLRSLAASPAEVARPVWWCFGARSTKEHPFANEVRNLLKILPESHSLILYSRPDATETGYDMSGRLDLSKLRTVGVPQNADFYLCGPASFIADLAGELKDWGVASSRIHRESFQSEGGLTPGITARSDRQPHTPPGDRGQGPEVTFTRSGLVVPWNPQFGNLLAFAEACGVPVRWSCRVGVCHTCENGLIDGVVRYAPEPLDQPASGEVLICCSSPLTAVQLDL